MEVKTVIVNGVEDVAIIKEFIDENQIKDNECYIENYYSHISPGTELSRVYGLKKGATYPFRVGYSAVGKVLAKGNNLKDIEVGDFVLYSGNHSSHHLFNPQNSDGGILYKLPKDLPIDRAPCLVLCWVAMSSMLVAEVKVTDTVAIFGLGVLGMVLSILYRQAGVKVIGIDPVVNRAKDIDLDLYISDLDHANEKILEFTSGRGADIAVDASGKSAGICSAIFAARTGGQVILLGSPRESLEMDITPVLNALHMKMLTVRGAFNRLFPYNQREGSIYNIKESLDYLSELVIKKIIDTDSLVSHVIAPEEAMTAYQGLMYDKANYIGVIIDWHK